MINLILGFILGFLVTLIFLIVLTYKHFSKYKKIDLNSIFSEVNKTFNFDDKDFKE